MVDDHKKLARLKWKCRRGMLETDFFLERFIKNKLESLTADELDTFDRLLDEPDPVLLTWFMEHQKPDDIKLQALVNLIIRSGDAKNKQ